MTVQMEPVHLYSRWNDLPVLLLLRPLPRTIPLDE